MIHLIKQNGKFRVVDVAANHEVIKESQRRGLTTRKAAIKNIRATAKLYDAKIGYELEVQDDTGMQPRMIVVSENSVRPSTQKAGRAYKPGKMHSPGTAAKRAAKPAPAKAVSMKTPASTATRIPPVRTLPAKHSAMPAKKSSPVKKTVAKKAMASRK